MDLQSILALRPADADATTLREAIRKAEVLQNDLAQRAARLEEARANLLLTAEEDELLAAEREADQARLAADRLEALLPLLREDLQAAAVKEEVESAVSSLQAEAAEAHQSIAHLEAWSRDFERIQVLIGKGLQLQDRAERMLRSFLAHVDAAYRSQAMRDAGPLAIAEPRMPSLLPRQQFPTWSCSDE